MGALVSKPHLDKVKNYVKIGVEEGGFVQCGETVAAGDLLLQDDDDENENVSKGEGMENGYFMAPTVITDLKDTSRCMQEEIFENGTTYVYSTYYTSYTRLF